jgi:hypothetical protein
MPGIVYSCDFFVGDDLTVAGTPPKAISNAVFVATPTDFLIKSQLSSAHTSWGGVIFRNTENTGQKTVKPLNYSDSVVKFSGVLAE